MQRQCYNKVMHSIREVAKQAGVSTATVSRAFNNPELIAPHTHRRVLEAADNLNYRPLRVRGRKITPSPAAAVAVDTFLGFQFFSADPGDLIQANPFYAPLMAGAQAAADAAGMHLLVNTTDRHALEQELPRMVREQTVAGMLLVGTADPEILSVFLERVPEIVLVDHRDPTGQHDCVISDGVGGMAEATRYLLGLGHRRIAFLQDAADVPTFRDRLRGFVCAHFEAGLSVDPARVLTANAAALPGVLGPLLKSAERPTALVAANDSQAYQVMQLCRTLGVSIPGDLSLVGFDNIGFSAQTWPPLTTVHVPKKQMGSLAVSRLQARLQATEGSLESLPPVTLEVPVSLKVRQSCRALS